MESQLDSLAHSELPNVPWKRFPKLPVYSGIVFFIRVYAEGTLFTKQAVYKTVE